MAPPPRGVEAQQLLAEYDLGDVLGQGAFGVVYACTRKGTKDFDLAVKMVDKVETPVAEIRREVEMLMAVDHPAIVRCHNVYYEKFFVCIVMDRYSGGDLIEGMQRHWTTLGQIPVPKLPRIIIQMATAIAHLHLNLIIHRDVKGDNFLMDRQDMVDPNCRIIMSDFGTARRVKPDERLSSTVGTKLYWSPEFFAANYGLKVDIWALGVIVYGLINGRFPFKGERDVNQKNVRISDKVPEVTKDFVLRLLDKNEATRIPGSEVVEHPWLNEDGAQRASIVPASRQGDDMSPPTSPTGRAGMDLVKEAGANVGVAERRKELVERLVNKENRQKKPEAKASQEIFWKARFAVIDRHSGKEVRYEWWSPERVDAAQILTASTAASLGETHTDDHDQGSVEVVSKMLEEHHIDTSSWGAGTSKRLDQFAAEVQSGAATLMLQAGSYKKLVRVVDVVLLRIAWGDGAEKRFLVETSETFADGRTRTGLDRLPGSKREPHESTKRAAERMLQEMRDATGMRVVLDFASREQFEEEEESRSYPGVVTVYRKELIEGRVVDAGEDLLQKLGLVGHDADGGFATTHASGLITEYSWFAEEVCQSRSVKLRAPAEGEEISGLVQAPIGFSEEELLEFLQRNGVDVNQFGHGHAKTLKEFSTELIKGEASIMLARDGRILRIVDVVLLHVVKQGVGDLLMELQEKHTDGTIHGLNRLPGAKRRPDENQFVAARRCLRKHLKMDENYVDINQHDVRIIEEEKDSPSYPGIRTVYRKRVISAELRREAPAAS